MKTTHAVRRRLGRLPIVALLVAGCASTRGTERLPFHVALTPPLLTQVSFAPADGEDDRLRLELDEARLGESMTRSLEERFARVTLLARPEGEAGGGGADAPAADWVEASRRAGADHQLEVEVAYDPLMDTSTNSKFWPNMSLFVLGGPGCYFVNDRAYSGSCRMRGTFHDVGVLASGHASLDDGTSEVLEVEAYLDETSLDFIDRAGWNPWLYLKSLLIPAGLLAKRGTNVEASLSDEVTEALTRRFDTGLSEGADRLIRAEATRGFYLAQPVRIEVEGGIARLSATVVIRREARPRMDSYSVRYGDSVVTGTFDGIEPQAFGDPAWGTFLAYPLEVGVPVGSVRGDGAPRLELSLVSGGREQDVRTYTLIVP
jgi:hypothetical protein